MIQPIIGVRFVVEGHDVDIVYGPLADGTEGWTVHAGDEVDLDTIDFEQGAEALLTGHGLIPAYEALRAQFPVLIEAAKQARERDAVEAALEPQMPRPN